MASTRHRTKARATSAQTQIQEMVERIVRQFTPDKIILFGSHARGCAGPDSDVDLLIVMPVTVHRLALSFLRRQESSLSFGSQRHGQSRPCWGSLSLWGLQPGTGRRSPGLSVGFASLYLALGANLNDNADSRLDDESSKR